MNDKQPIYIPANTNCMDEPIPAYWRQELTCSNGRLILGFGNTKEEATRKAIHERNEIEEFLSKPDLEQLKIIVNKDTILSTDTTTALKLIAKILLKNEQPRT